MQPSKTLLRMSSEIVLGGLVALLSVLTAVSGYQGSMADSEQTKYNVQGQQMLTNANSAYLLANQNVVYDYTMYDGWFTNDDTEKVAYYRDNFSNELQASIALNADDPFSENYYQVMYEEPDSLFAEADRLFSLAEAFNGRGDSLQLIVMISALGLAFAAWSSLLRAESWVRVFFAVAAIAAFFYCSILYAAVPNVVG